MPSISNGPRCSTRSCPISLPGLRESGPRMRDNGRLVMQKLLLAMAVGLATVFQSGHALAGKDLDAVKARGVLICGVAARGLSRFMLADSQGQWTCPHAHVCRAVAGALFGESG